MTSDDFFWEKFVKNMIDFMIVEKRGVVSLNLWFKCVGGCCDRKGFTKRVCRL